MYLSTTAPTPILHCHLHNAPLAEFAPPLLLHRAWSDWPPLQDFRTASPRLSGLNPRRGISTDYSMDLAGIIFWEGGVCQPLSSHPTPPVLAKAVTGWEKSASASLNIIIMHAHLNVGGMLRVKRLSLGSQIGGWELSKLVSSWAALPSIRTKSAVCKDILQLNILLHKLSVHCISECGVEREVERAVEICGTKRVVSNWTVPSPAAWGDVAKTCRFIRQAWSSQPNNIWLTVSIFDGLESDQKCYFCAKIIVRNGRG